MSKCTALLFANENCKLQNEAKMNVTFERSSARDPRHSPLSAEMKDASAWRISVPVVQFVMTLFATTARVERSRTKRVLIAHNSLKDTAVALMWTSVSDNGLLLFWAMLFTACEWWGQQQLVPHAEKRVFRECVPDEWVPDENALFHTWFQGIAEWRVATLLSKMITFLLMRKSTMGHNGLNMSLLHLLVPHVPFDPPIDPRLTRRGWLVHSNLN